MRMPAHLKNLELTEATIVPVTVTLLAVAFLVQQEYDLNFNLNQCIPVIILQEFSFRIQYHSVYIVS